MAITFGPIIAGPYTASYNSLAVGFTIDGFRWSQKMEQEVINETDLFASTIIDTIYRGMNARMSYRSRVYNANNIAPISPWGALGVVFTAAAPIARNARSVAKAFVLTSVAATPAAAAPASLAANLSLLAEGTDTELLFDSKAREVPVVLQLYPYESNVDGTLVNAILT